MGRIYIEHNSHESTGDSVSVVIKYGDFAVGAKEAFNLEATDQIYFSNLQQVKENIQFLKVKNVLK